MLGKIAKSKVELVLDGKIVDSRVIDLPVGDTEVGRHVREISENLMVAALRIALSYVIKGSYQQGLQDFEKLIDNDYKTKGA
jgi:hypothetical protein